MKDTTGRSRQIVDIKAGINVEVQNFKCRRRQRCGIKKEKVDRPATVQLVKTALKAGANFKSVANSSRLHTDGRWKLVAFQCFSFVLVNFSGLG